MTHAFWRRLCALIGCCPATEEDDEEETTEARTGDDARHERRTAALRDAQDAQESAWRVLARASRVRAELQHKPRR